MRKRHRGESMKETILTDRGRQTCKEDKRQRGEHRGKSTEENTEETQNRDKNDKT